MVRRPGDLDGAREVLDGAGGLPELQLRQAAVRQQRRAQLAALLREAQGFREEPLGRHVVLARGLLWSRFVRFRNSSIGRSFISKDTEMYSEIESAAQYLRKKRHWHIALWP